jgi:hypothetical protein
MKAKDTPENRYQLGQQFYQWVGRCITAWSDIEARLFECCWYCLGSTRERTSIVYYRTPTLDARLTLADELVGTIFPKSKRKSGGHPHPDIKHWARIVSDLRTHLATRRRIAHHPVGQVIEPIVQDGALTGELQISWEIYTSSAEKLRQANADYVPLTMQHLIDHHTEISTLKGRLKEFVGKKLIPQLEGHLPPDAPQQKD